MNLMMKLFEGDFVNYTGVYILFGNSYTFHNFSEGQRVERLEGQRVERLEG